MLVAGKSQMERRALERVLELAVERLVVDDLPGVGVGLPDLGLVDVGVEAEQGDAGLAHSPTDDTDVVGDEIRRRVAHHRGGDIQRVFYRHGKRVIQAAGAQGHVARVEDGEHRECLRPMQEGHQELRATLQPAVYLYKCRMVRMHYVRRSVRELSEEAEQTGRAP